MSDTCTALTLAQFFFGNFWHWLGLLLIVGALGGSVSIRRNSA